MTKKFNTKKLANLFFELGTLRKIPRAHMQTLLTSDLSDNIASHSFRVAMIGWFLARIENADSNRVLLMCLFHDIAEARSGDQNWVHKKYVKVFEEEITQDQIEGLPSKAQVGKVHNEYIARETKEAKIAKDADLIDQILLLKEYEWSGNREASDWLRGEQQYNRISSKAAKKLAEEIVKQKPHAWWNNIWTEKRR